MFLSYISDTYRRMSIHQIISFLIDGSGTNEELPYKDMLMKSCNSIYERLDNLYSKDVIEREKANADLSQALDAYEYVYMNLGMKAGARLIYQLLLTDEK